MNRFAYIKCLYCLLFLVAITSCKPKDNTITIKGDIKGLDVQWVYLYKSSFDPNPKPVDSAKVIKNKFEFSFHPDTTFQPYLGYITYRTKANLPYNLSIINPVTSTLKKLDLAPYLYIEPGITSLTGDLTKSQGITLTSGKQNDFYFKNSYLPYNNISRNSTKRQLQINNLKQLIKDNQDAYYPMVALINIRFKLTHDELKSIYDCFDDEVRTAYDGRTMKEFLKPRPGIDALKPNAILIDSNEKKIALIDTAKKLNMIIFWASWCGPCKEEIPSLKKIAAEFTNPSFRMVSVSVDRDKDKWKHALVKQKMPWQQLVIEDADQERLSSQYDLNAIPQIYFLDRRGKAINHLIGYSPTNEAIIEKIITAALK